MVRIGLKIYYLRTRVLTISQARLAEELGVRQATISHIERGRSEPTVALLLAICRFFDVTPTYLIDPDRGLPLRPGDRWSLRDALVTVGMWIEAPEDALSPAGEGKVFVPLLPDQSFYDEEALEAVRDLPSSKKRLRHLDQRIREDLSRSQELEQQIEAELAQHPRRRKPKNS